METFGPTDSWELDPVLRHDRVEVLVARDGRPSCASRGSLLSVLLPRRQSLVNDGERSQLESLAKDGIRSLLRGCAPGPRAPGAREQKRPAS
mmetsp:Transcript_5512/g.14787  ORF Transcript_5512/g.14787 Transcript_5512/m.14787 type:complete len:92 (+) Transcript_5512:353-628(+)